MKHWRAPLSQKVVILIGLPVLFEVVFLLTVLSLTAKAEADTRKTVRASHILQACQDLNTELINTLTSLAKVSADSDRPTALTAICSSGMQKLGAASLPLRNLLDSPLESPKLLQNLDGDLQKVREELASAESILGSASSSQRVQFALRANQSLTTLQRTITRITKPYLSLAEDYPRQQSSANSSLAFILFCGIGANVVLCAWLAWLAGQTVFIEISYLMTFLNDFKLGRKTDQSVDLSEEIKDIELTIQEAQTTILNLENDLRSSELRSNTVLNATPDGLLVVNANGLILLCNQSAQLLLSKNSESLANWNLRTVLPDVELDELELGRPKEVVAHTAEFGAVPVDVTKGLMQSSSEILFVVIIRDVRARHHARRIKEEAISTLKEELRGPLFTVQATCATLMQTSSFTEMGKRKIAANVASCTRLLTLIDRLDDATNKGTAVREQTNLAQLLESAVVHLQALADRSSISIVVTNRIDQPVLCDASGMSRVLSNLVSNALKFSPPGTVISIDAESQSNDLLLKISDQGRGIPKDKIDTLFNKFQQVEHSDRHKGSGLGLTICSQIVEAHGGTICVTSEPGRGSTFTIHLPGCLLCPIQLQPSS